MVTETTIRRIGNSQGVTIPKELCDEMGLPVGSRVRISSENGGIFIAPARGRTLRDRMTEWDGVRYQSPETDWGKPTGNEMW